MSQQIDARVKIENSTGVLHSTTRRIDCICWLWCWCCSAAAEYEALAGELRLQWYLVTAFSAASCIDCERWLRRLNQTKANEAMRRQIEAHGKKLDIMREQHDEVMMMMTVMGNMVVIVMLMVTMMPIMMMMMMMMIMIMMMPLMMMMAMFWQIDAAACFLHFETQRPLPSRRLLPY
jgi:hypothetical protein